MNRFLKFLAIPAITTAVMTGCSEIDENYSGGSGFISLELAIDPEVRSSQAQGNYSITAPAAEDFSVTLTDATGQYSHTWPSLADFPTLEQYRTGAYTIAAQYGSLDNEGFDMPCFQGSSDITVTEATQTKATVTCTIANTLVSINYTDSFKAYFKEYSAELHSTGGIYLNVPGDETRTAFLRPGDVNLTLSLTLPTGAKTTFSPATIYDAQPQHHYRLNIDVNNGDVGDATLVITIDDTMDDHTVSIDLSNDLIAAPAPEVTPVGFTPGVPVKLNEGETPSATIAMDINARNGLSEIILTTHSQSLTALGWPAEINLLKADEATRDKLTALGLKTQGIWHNPDRMAVIDFTDVIAWLTNSPSDVPEASFTVVVKDNLTKVNEPVTLDINIEPVDLTVKQISPAVVGINKATITVKAPSVDLKKNVVIQMLDNKTWTSLTIDDIIPTGEPSIYTITFNVPEGTSAVNARVLYCNRLKGSFTIERKSPEYTVDVDPFASRARVKVSARDASVVELVTRYLSVYVNSSQASILERDPSTGLLTILGLNPSTTYRLKTTILNQPGDEDYTPEILFTTEGTPTIPNADFEDIKESIKASNFLSGGRYSQNTVEIYNRQNTVSFKYSVPVKGWATTNDKTFCRQATNKNTWYMQPSVYTISKAVSGGYAVTLKSVAFDVSGQEIPDYLQTGQPFTNYSLNIPYIESRAAGKLFLGEYAFDPLSMTERYNEGVSFHGRPASVNGFYMFEPCRNFTSDRGLVSVEVIGNDGTHDIVIASGQLGLPLATSYTSFSVPLTYRHFGVKATKLKLMFASTNQSGSLAKERTSVITWDDPVTSTSIGSILTIDNLSLSY